MPFLRGGDTGARYCKGQFNSFHKGKHMQTFPLTRPRRMRKQTWQRELIAETLLTKNDFVYPLFIMDTDKGTEPIGSLPNIFRLGRYDLLKECEEVTALGIKAIAIFPRTPQEKKDIEGTEASNPKNLVCSAVRAIREQFPELGVICDVALDPYTSHGHDGVLLDGQVHNDITLKRLVAQALTLAESGCEMVAPSDMMDGRIRVIREAFEEKGFSDTCILSYAAKYASAFYGPFREAVGSQGSLQGASKATYQMDPRNSDESLNEVRMDINEGADCVMVKPALAYLDIISKVKQEFGVPTFAYQVSGEYAMIHAAAKEGMLPLERTMMETLTSIKRAGADAIFTYYAKEAAKILAKG